MTTQIKTVRHPLMPVVRPESILVVGASSSRSWATGNQVIRSIRASNYRGRVEVVNPAGGVVEGIEAARSATDIAPVDLAVVTVAPAAVLPALGDAHRGGARVALVMSVGMSAAERDELAAFARRTGMAVHGPNCMGVINVRDGLRVWADEGNLTGLSRGCIALISQSGSGAIFVSRSIAGAGFSHVISTGNETVVTTADYIDLLVDDDETAVIGLILESIGDPDGLSDAVTRAREAGKPVIALKVGRSRAGAQATVAHTGAMLAPDAVVTAYFQRLGIPLVKDYDELAAALELLAWLSGRSVGRGRIGAVTISGGQAALTADLAESADAILAELSAQTRASLAGVLPGAGINNPLDAGGSEDVADDWYGKCLDLLAQDPNVDVVLVITDSQASLNDVEIDYEDELIAEARAAAMRHDKPIIMASSSSESIHSSRRPVAGDPSPMIRGIGNALTAIVAASVALAPPKPTPTRPAGIPTPTELAGLRAAVRASVGVIDNALGARLLSAYGVPTAPSTRVSSVDEALVWAETNGYPVVLKIDSPDIPHRTEVGGVVMGIVNGEELRKGWAGLFDRVRAARPDAELVGAELQVHLADRLEAMVGAVGDAAIGAAVGVGIGGVLVELIGDTVSALAPVTHETARTVLSKTRLRRLLDGYRNLHPVIDDGPLVETVVRVSWLMHDFRGFIAEFEANPVLIDSHTGAVHAVDVLLVPFAPRGQM